MNYTNIFNNYVTLFTKLCTILANDFTFNFRLKSFSGKVIFKRFLL